MGHGSLRAAGFAAPPCAGRFQPKSEDAVIRLIEEHCAAGGTIDDINQALVQTVFAIGSRSGSGGCDGQKEVEVAHGAWVEATEPVAYGTLGITPDGGARKRRLHKPWTRSWYGELLNTQTN